jgi:hypothetical protein
VPIALVKASDAAMDDIGEDLGDARFINGNRELELTLVPQRRGPTDSESLNLARTEEYNSKGILLTERKVLCSRVRHIHNVPSVDVKNDESETGVSPLFVHFGRDKHARASEVYQYGGALRWWRF